MNPHTQKNQTGGSGSFDTVQLVGKNDKDSNTADKRRPKKQSRRKAIDLYCKSCNYDSQDKGTWRKQIEDCPCTSCPLYDFRPKTTPKRVFPEVETAKANL